MVDNNNLKGQDAKSNEENNINNVESASLVPSNGIELADSISHEPIKPVISQSSVEKSTKAKIFEKLLICASRFFTGMSAFGEKNVPSGPVIYYANHQSHLDGIAVWSSLPAHKRKHVHPIAAKGYWGQTPLKHYIATEVFNALLIDREKETRTTDPIEEMANMLSKGESLIIFPEGTRGNGQQIEPFKSGLYHLAKLMPQVPCVPVYLHNLHRVLPKGSKLIVPILCETHFGEPLAPMHAGEEKEAFLVRAHTALEALKHAI